MQDPRLAPIHIYTTIKTTDEFQEYVSDGSGRGWLGVVAARKADLSGWLGAAVAQKADLNWKL